MIENQLFSPAIFSWQAILITAEVGESGNLDPEMGKKVISIESERTRASAGETEREREKSNTPSLSALPHSNQSERRRESGSKGLSAKETEREGRKLKKGKNFALHSHSLIRANETE